ncbi:hypothetical protein [Streptomyces sp. IB201691-2A2]|uniref:hypothetical protein n=1 Tax=Streptomyces sp. IB201691-2A2 TaxID=2561920 RepID=UPI0011808B23|nr:hypothetical protein [Streptomyces sp. IB201691-2A2]TRO56123.1 hypothetical protein E4K73_47885 [Streptomyces sp. IB201691-2A2]
MTALGRRIRFRYSPTQWVYLLVHALLFAVGVALYQIKGAFSFSIATSLISTGVAGWVIFLWVRQSESHFSTMQSLESLGIIKAFTARSIPIRHEYEPRFSASRREISIMGFGLRALREDFGDEFTSWAARSKVRILLLDPDAPGTTWSYAAQRDREEGNSDESIANDVRAFLAYTREVRAAHPQTFQVRLYRCIPSINLCIVDDDVFWGPYLLGRQSRDTVTLLCGKGGPLYVTFVRHFEQIWSDPEMSHEAAL